MLSLRTRIFVIIGAIVLILALVGTALFVRSRLIKKTTNSQNQNSQTDTTIPAGTAPIAGETPATIPAGLPVRQPTSEEARQNGIKQLARVFVERYGTYSTDNDNQNIEEVKTLVTPELWQKIAPKNTTPASDFVGVTTQVVSMDFTSLSATEAKLSFKTLRTQLKAGQTTTLQQAINVTMTKKGESWLVSDFVWQK